jgi:hypothetical protein
MSEKPLIDPARGKILSLPEETKFAANGIVSRMLLRTANLRTVLFGFAEGQELTEHTSTQQALIQILSGECAILPRRQAAQAGSRRFSLHAAQPAARRLRHDAILDAAYVVQARRRGTIQYTFSQNQTPK